MGYVYWIAGVILALAWFSRIVDAALGMPSVGDVSRPGVKNHFQNSTFVRDIILYAGVPRVDVKMDAEWHEKHILLKVKNERNQPTMRMKMSTHTAAKAVPRSRKTSMVMCHSPSHFNAGASSVKGWTAL